MPLPRFRIRTLMIAAAVVALGLAMSVRPLTGLCGLIILDLAFLPIVGFFAGRRTLNNFVAAGIIVTLGIGFYGFQLLLWPGIRWLPELCTPIPMPIPRMTARRWMIAAAVVGTTVATGELMRRRSNSFRRQAAKREGREIEWGAGLELFEHDLRLSPSPDVLIGAAEYRRRTEYYKALRIKYEQAARRPWLPVPPDPPEPK